MMRIVYLHLIDDYQSGIIRKTHHELPLRRDVIKQILKYKKQYKLDNGYVLNLILSLYKENRLNTMLMKNDITYMEDIEHES